MQAAELARLRELAATKRLYFGAAVSDRQLKRPESATLITEQCSILVVENQMKWRATHPEQDRYDFTTADFFMDFAASRRILARGHNLCWHEYNPEWLEAAATHENAVSLLRSHIQTVVGRYKGRIHSWDVVNEAIRPDHHNHNGMVNSVWLKNIGEDYVEIAFPRRCRSRSLLRSVRFDVVIVVGEERGGIGFGSGAESDFDVVFADVLQPDGIDHAIVIVVIGAYGFVHDIPGMDAALVAADNGLDVRA